MFCRCILIYMTLNRNFTLHYKEEHLIHREGDFYPIYSSTNSSQKNSVKVMGYI